MKSLTVAVLVALATCAPTAVRAQKQSLGERVSALEQAAAAQGNSAGQANVELVNRLAQMQAEVQELRNQVETLRNENEQLKQRGREQYVDLDTRLQRVEGGAGTGGSAPVAASPAPPRPAAAPPLSAPAPAAAPGGDEAYAAAFQALRRDDFVESARAFQAYLRDYPDGALAPNAWYWLGESYYVTQNYPLALQAFDTVVTRFPDSTKAPDAMLKKGYGQIELGQSGPGMATLNAVINEFPGTEAARLANSRLRTLSLQTR